MTPAALVAARMTSLRLHNTVRGTSVVDVVRWMGALQAQDYESGLWAIGVRASGITRADVEGAIARREIVRTWPMRGTWHFVPAEDAAWMQALMNPRVVAAIVKRSTDMDLDEKTVNRGRNAVAKALAGGTCLARERLVDVIAAAGISTAEQRGNHLLRRFGNEGLLCNGPVEGKEPTFALLDEWVPKPAQRSREESLAEIALRYFRSHGPATPDDFAWWSGLPKADVRVGIAANTTLVSAVLGGKVCWYVESGVADVAPVELLPAFDEHLLGYCDRTAVLDDDRAESVCPGGNGVFRPTLVVKGRVAGLWKRKEAAKKATVELSPYRSLPRAVQKDVELAARRYATFLGKPVTLGGTKEL